MSRLTRLATLPLALGGWAFLLLTGCNPIANVNAPAAYVAPATLNLRPEISQKNTPVAVLRHGERVSVIEVRRRFVKVRTQKGAQGWVDSTQLLTAGKMSEVQRATDVALRLPSEGAAGVYEPLNVHLEPSRQSPAFTRIPDGGSVEVLGHKLTPKIQGPAKAPVFNLPKPAPSRKASRKAQETRNVFPLPRLEPPKPPSDADDFPRSEPEAQPAETNTAKPVLEDWTLVRTKDRQVGWVLSRNLNMSIPDEVAQYAEGHRITSYFSLGTVNDEEKGKKNNWLWTTLSGQQTCDFDAWRVFLWNRRRHRYETSYRQRDVEGYFPVHVEAAEAGSLDSRFSLVIKEDNGQMLVKSYRFDGTRVHADTVTPYAPPASPSAK